MAASFFSGPRVRISSMNSWRAVLNSGVLNRSLLWGQTVPEGWHCYDLCGTERRPHKPSAIMDHVIWGRVGTVLQDLLQHLRAHFLLRRKRCIAAGELSAGLFHRLKSSPCRSILQRRRPSAAMQLTGARSTQI